jgi:hypothetical protein
MELLSNLFPPSFSSLKYNKTCLLIIKFTKKTDKVKCSSSIILHQKSRKTRAIKKIRNWLTKTEVKTNGLKKISAGISLVGIKLQCMDRTITATLLNNMRDNFKCNNMEEANRPKLFKTIVNLV